MAIARPVRPRNIIRHGLNKRKMEDARKTEADEEAATRRELGPQILEYAVRLIADWNERQAKRANPACGRGR